jgi:NAD+ diphosphatase
MPDSTYWFIIRGHTLLVAMHNNAPEIPCLTNAPTLAAEPIRTMHIGTFMAKPCYAIDIPEDLPAPEGMSFSELRPLIGSLSDELFSLAGRAFQLIHWDRTCRFCIQCATPLMEKSSECAKQCPACGYVCYPPIAPAVIVAVVHDRKILLAHGNRFRPGLFSVLAGFVEAGETLEACVHREIREEVGIEVTDIKYFGSMSWPFPNSLMVGFTCRYASGEIVADKVEIAEADWYSPDELPETLPAKGTLSRKLIDWFLAETSPLKS